MNGFIRQPLPHSQIPEKKVRLRKGAVDRRSLLESCCRRVELPGQELKFSEEDVPDSAVRVGFQNLVDLCFRLSRIRLNQSELNLRRQVQIIGKGFFEFEKKVPCVGSTIGALVQVNQGERRRWVLRTLRLCFPEHLLGVFETLR